MRRLALLSFLALGACSQGGIEVNGPFDDPTLSVYNYRAFNGGGTLIAQGSLGLALVPEDAIPPGIPPNERVVYRVRGIRQLTAVGSSAGATTHAGSGDVRGQITGDGVMTLDLNAGVADQNVVLTVPGVLQANDFDGTWALVTLAGEVERGRFETALVRAATEFEMGG